VINSSSIKPLGEETILAEAEKVGLVVTAEEHQIAGGLGSAVCELLSERSPRRVRRRARDRGQGWAFRLIARRRGRTLRPHLLRGKRM